MLKDESTQQHSISMYPAESAEWQGPLPVGQPADDYLLTIFGKARYQRFKKKSLFDSPRKPGRKNP